MLQTMRNNAQGMFAKVIMGFLVIVFGLWGVESIVSIGGGEQAVVEVDGQKITESDIERAVEIQRANLSRQFGDQFNEEIFNDRFLRQSAIEQLINEKVTVLQAQKLGLEASKRSIDESIVQETAFHQDGRFNVDQFRTVLAMNGLTPSSFRNAMANEIVVNQAQSAFALTSFATEFEGKLLAKLDNEERTFKYAEVTAKDFLNKVELTDADIEAAYEQSKERFRTPEQASVRYVEIKLDDIAQLQQVSDSELNKAYDDYKKRQSVSEQRSASHILLELDGRSLKEAKALAQEIKQKLDNGEDFGALAQQYSDDIGTKMVGGDLGLSPRGSYDAAFDDALYSLALGAVSEPVETEYGVHLIRADKIIAADVASFADMKAELTNEIRQEKAQSLYQAKIIEMSDAAFAAQSIDELAKQLNLDVLVSALFTRDAGEGVAANTYVRDAAYADNVLFDKELSPMIELPNSAVVLAVKEHHEESFKPLAEVKEQLVAVLKQQRASFMAHEQIQKIMAGEAQADWKTVTSTYSHNSEAPEAVQIRAFSLTKGQMDSVQTTGGFAVVKLTQIEAKSWQDAELDTQSLEIVRVFNGRTDLFSYQYWARSASKIKNKKS